MHAAVVNVTIDPARAEEAEKTLKRDIVPAISGAPGFVAGYWLAPENGKATSMVVFDTEEQIRQSAPEVGSHPSEGVTIDSVEIREVRAGA